MPQLRAAVVCGAANNQLADDLAADASAMSVSNSPCFWLRFDAATTEAPQWPGGRRGRIPKGLFAARNGDSQVLVRVAQVSKTFHMGGQVVRGLYGVDLDIHAGETVALIEAALSRSADAA